MPPALAAAIRDGDTRAVGKLIEAGADVNARDAEGNTPLILAAFYAGPRCVEVLLEKGADPNAANRAGVTALIRAATDYEKTCLLIAAGAKVGVRTADLGNTPLILAARRAGNSRTVRLLLERGAGAAERDEAGISPIMAGGGRGGRRGARRGRDQPDHGGGGEWRRGDGAIAAGGRREGRRLPGDQSFEGR